MLCDLISILKYLYLYIRYDEDDEYQDEYSDDDD